MFHSCLYIFLYYFFLFLYNISFNISHISSGVFSSSSFKNYFPFFITCFSSMLFHGCHLRLWTNRNICWIVNIINNIFYLVRFSFIVYGVFSRCLFYFLFISQLFPCGLSTDKGFKIISNLFFHCFGFLFSFFYIFFSFLFSSSSPPFFLLHSLRVFVFSFNHFPPLLFFLSFSPCFTPFSRISFFLQFSFKLSAK